MEPNELDELQRYINQYFKDKKITTITKKGNTKSNYMIQQNPFLAWLQESLQRLFKKSPKFFRIWQIVLGFVTTVTGIPALLTDWGVVLPPELTFLQNKFIGAASLGALIMTQLSTSSTVVGVTQQGEILKTTDQKALPFTAMQEEKKAIKEATETVEVKTETGKPVDTTGNPVTDLNSPNKSSI